MMFEDKVGVIREESTSPGDWDENEKQMVAAIRSGKAIELFGMRVSQFNQDKTIDITFHVEDGITNELRQLKSRKMLQISKQDPSQSDRFGRLMDLIIGFVSELEMLKSEADRR